MPNLFSVKSERNSQRPKMKITGYIFLVLCVLNIFLLYPGYCECYIVETLCSLASSEVCSFSMFVLVCSCLGWYTANSSGLVEICPMHSLGSPLSDSPFWNSPLTFQQPWLRQILPSGSWGQKYYGFSTAFLAALHSADFSLLSGEKWVPYPVPFF